MSEMLKITLQDPGLAEALKAKSSRVMAVLSVKLNAILFQLEGKIKAKLSGQVLHVRTGVLRASVHAIPAEVQGSKILGSVEAGGGPSSLYASVHELGGSHAYQILTVKARALKFLPHGKEVYAHSVIHPPAMQRSYLASTLTEESENIKAALQAALDKAVSE